MKEQIYEVYNRYKNTDMDNGDFIEEVMRIVEAQPQKRYFVVWCKRLGKISRHDIITDGCFINPTDVERQAAELLACDPKDVILTNWVELSEADYNDWIK